MAFGGFQQILVPEGRGASIVSFSKKVSTAVVDHFGLFLSVLRSQVWMFPPEV